MRRSWCGGGDIAQVPSSLQAPDCDVNSPFSHRHSCSTTSLIVAGEFQFIHCSYQAAFTTNQYKQGIKGVFFIAQVSVLQSLYNIKKARAFKWNLLCSITKVKILKERACFFIACVLCAIYFHYDLLQHALIKCCIIYGLFISSSNCINHWIMH